MKMREILRDGNKNSCYFSHLNIIIVFSSLLILMFFFHLVYVNSISTSYLFQFYYLKISERILRFFSFLLNCIAYLLNSLRLLLHMSVVSFGGKL